MAFQLSLFAQEGLDSQFQSLMRMIPATECDYATHNVHPYPAKFLPHYPRLYIHHFSDEGDTVLDPMCGSGTTLTEACLQNRHAYGIDIDPIAALISRVSVTPISETVLRDYEQELFAEVDLALAQDRTAEVELPSDEDFPNALLWFREDVLRELIVIRDVILGFDVSADLRDFALLCLSSIVKDVSNADPRDIFPERDQENLVRERKDVIAELRRAFHDNRVRVADFTAQVNGEHRGIVHRGDARNIDLPDDSVKLIFTSPPYAYAMDYARVHKLSSLLFVMSNVDFRELRREYVGTDRVSVKESMDSFEGFEFAREEIESVYEQSRKLGIVLYKYFSGMHTITEECIRVLQPGGHLVYVIGNSTVRRTHFRTDEVFAGICEGLGLQIVDRRERPYYAYRMSRKRNVQSNTIKADVFITSGVNST